MVIEPIHIIAFGCVVVAAGFIWQAVRPPVKPDTIAPELKDRLDRIQMTFERYVKPRELTEDQIKAISEFLLPRTKHRVQIFFGPTDEANSFAGQIYQGFKGGDWDIPEKGIRPISARADLTNHEGMGVYAALPIGVTGAGKPYDLAMEALARAKLPFRGSGSIRSQTDSEYVVIVVGQRETR